MIGEVNGKWNTESSLWIVVSGLRFQTGSKRLQAQRAAGFDLRVILTQGVKTTP